MSKHTVVLSFEDGKEPTYHAGMQVLGGSVGAVQFSDALEEMQLLEELRDELLGALSNLLSVYAKPDELICCNGRECGCMGASVYEQAEHYARAAIAKAKGQPCTPSTTS